MLREELRKANDALNEGEHGAPSAPYPAHPIADSFRLRTRLALGIAARDRAALRHTRCSRTSGREAQSSDRQSLTANNPVFEKICCFWCPVDDPPRPNSRRAQILRNVAAEDSDG